MACLLKEIDKKISRDGINMTMDAIAIDASLIAKMVRDYKKCKPPIVGLMLSSYGCF